MVRARWFRADACAQNDDVQERDRMVSQIQVDSGAKRDRSHALRPGRRGSDDNGEHRPTNAAKVLCCEVPHAHHCEASDPDGFQKGESDEVFTMEALRTHLAVAKDVE